MIYKNLGRTGLKVSAIGFGGIPIQRVSMDESARVIHHAQDIGINYIDTARGYTVSEEYIGNALKGRRDKWYIATKSMARTKEAMLKDIDISLKNLQTDYIDLYQIHNIKEMDSYDLVTGENGALEALIKAKNAGKIGHIGVTFHSLDVLKHAIESSLFETVMYPYNIIETQAQDAFKRAGELGIGVIAMKPMAGGALNNGTLAMRFIAGNNDISIAIPGMADIKEVDENVKAIENFKSLSDEEKKQCKDISEKMGQSFCRRCGYCAPCTKGIDIPFSFILRSYYENYDLKDWAVERYKSMKAHAEDCIECGACEKRCPYNLPIRDMLKEVRKSFGY